MGVVFDFYNSNDEADDDDVKSRVLSGNREKNM